MGTTLKDVKVHNNMSSACNDALLRAVSKWNAQGANFQFRYDKATSWTADRDSQVLAAHIGIEDGTMLLNATNLAETRMKRVASGGRYVITDAFTVVNYDNLYYYNGTTAGLYHCPATATAPPAGEWDYESLMLHELGHGLGLLDTNSLTACIMYYNLNKGQSRRTLCTDEYTSFRELYGIR